MLYPITDAASWASGGRPLNPGDVDGPIAESLTTTRAESPDTVSLKGRARTQDRSLMQSLRSMRHN